MCRNLLSNLQRSSRLNYAHHHEATFHRLTMTIVCIGTYKLRREMIIFKIEYKQNVPQRKRTYRVNFLFSVFIHLWKFGKKWICVNSTMKIACRSYYVILQYFSSSVSQEKWCNIFPYLCRLKDSLSIANFFHIVQQRQWEFSFYQFDWKSVKTKVQ